MLKKLNFYIFKIFIFYFCIIYIILLFLFIIEFFWTKLNDIMGKGINTFTIINLLFYFGISLIPLITPISILLTSIMTYGIFSESGELIATKSLGISFWKMLNFNFIIVFIISIIIYLFSDYIIPFSQKKIKNIAYNISKMKYEINIPTGIFIDYIPNIIIKVDEKISKNYFKGIFIRIADNSLKKKKTIIAKKGLFSPCKKNFIYLKLIHGTIYDINKNYYQIIKFDTLIKMLKIKSLVENKENLILTLNTKELIKKIYEIKMNKKKYYINNFYFKKKIRKDEKYLLKIKLELQKKFSFSITCIIMFFIGSPIGAIIKKGNIGFPVIISLIIFVLYYILLTISEYLAEKGIINIIIGAWGPNMIMFPLGLYLTYKVNNDYYFNLI